MLKNRAEQVRDRVRAPTDEERSRIADDLRALAKPRLTGTDGAKETEATLRERLGGLGYGVRELPFEFSGWPGRVGLTAAGGAHILAMATATALLLADLPLGGVIAAIVDLALLAAMALLGPGSVDWLPFGREQAVNLLATRGGGPPRYLVVAHRDSKSQPIATPYRTAAAVVTPATALLVLLLALIALVAPVVLWAPLVLVVGGVAMAAGALLALGHAGNASPGALDNASGLTALLGVAARNDQDDVGFLLTDAEELGLAGARAAIPELGGVLGVINLDGLDDHGAFHLVERHGWPRRRGSAPHLAASVLAAAEALDIEVERRDVPPGILVEHGVFVRNGIPAVTLMRGSGRSLKRVHRPSDDLTRLEGSGVAAAIALVDGALAALRLPPVPHEKVLPETVTGRR